MTPKEKALELISKFCGISLRLSTLDVIVDGIRLRLAKDSSLFLVDQILLHIEYSYIDENILRGAKLYWQEVKEEINKL
jgi:hypothetical protein